MYVGFYFEQATSAWRRACWRIDRIHPSELLRKVPHIKFTLQLWLKWTRYLLLRKVSPVQSLFGNMAE